MRSYSFRKLKKKKKLKEKKSVPLTKENHVCTLTFPIPAQALALVPVNRGGLGTRKKLDRFDCIRLITPHGIETGHKKLMVFNNNEIITC